MGRANSLKSSPIWLMLCLAGGGNTTEAGVVTVVSAKSPITALSSNEVADIFLGRSNRFPNGAQATPIDLPESSAVRDDFYSKVAGKSPAQMKAHWSKIIFTGRGSPPKMAPTSAEIKKLLAENSLAIAYMDDTEVDAGVRVVRAP